MENQFVLRREHDEYAKRMEDEHTRQNHRLSDLEEAVKQYGALTISIEKMAISMEQMLTEQQKQGKRLEALESRDGEMWRKVVGYTITTVLGLVIGYAFTLLGGM